MFSACGSGFRVGSLAAHVIASNRAGRCTHDVGSGFEFCSAHVVQATELADLPIAATTPSAMPMHSQVKRSKSHCAMHKHLLIYSHNKVRTQLDQTEHIKWNVSVAKMEHSPPAMAPIGVLFLAGAGAGAAACRLVPFAASNISCCRLVTPLKTHDSTP